MTASGTRADAEPRPAGPTFRRPRRGGAGGRLLLGVCAGLARRWELRPRTIRIALAVTLVPFGAGLLVYAALALVMPADGATDADAGWRSELGRSFQQALVVLAAVFAVAVIVGAAAGLAVFGLGPLALLLATACLAAVIAIDHPRTWLLGVVTLALAAPAAAVELTGTTIERQAGSMRVAPEGPGAVAPAGYRAGLGPLFVDLRDFDAEDGTTTTIRARADLRTLVVALPTDRCFNLEVDYARDRTWVSRVVEAAGNRTSYLPSHPGYPGASRFSVQPEPLPWGKPTTLVAYGRAFLGDRGRYRRPAPDPASPTLRLELQSGRSQIHVRDYPLNVDPMVTPDHPGVTAPTLERIDGELRRASRAAEQDGSARPTVRVVDQGGAALVSVSDDRAMRSALRVLGEWLEYPAVQARKLAGACASRREIRAIRRQLAAAQEAEARAQIRRRPGSAVSRLLMVRRSLPAIIASQQELFGRTSASRGTIAPVPRPGEVGP